MYSTTGIPISWHVKPCRISIINEMRPSGLLALATQLPASESELRALCVEATGTSLRVQSTQIRSIYVSVLGIVIMVLGRYLVLALGPLGLVAT